MDNLTDERKSVNGFARDMQIQINGKLEKLKHGRRLGKEYRKQLLEDIKHYENRMQFFRVKYIYDHQTSNKILEELTKYYFDLTPMRFELRQLNKKYSKLLLLIIWLLVFSFMAVFFIIFHTHHHGNEI